MDRDAIKDTTKVELTVHILQVIFGTAAWSADGVTFMFFILIVDDGLFRPSA